MKSKASFTAILFLTFSLACVAESSPDLFTIPLPRHNPPLRFIVVGDAGTGDAHLRKGIAALVKRMRIDAILLVGDNVYPCGVQDENDPQWVKVTSNFAESGLTIYPILGNHDYGDPLEQGGSIVTCGHPSPGAQVRATGKIPHWIFPNRNYILQSPLVDIVMMDSQPIASDFKSPFAGSFTSKDEVDWLRAALATHEAKWEIVAGHHTIYSSGLHGVANDRYQRRMRSITLPILRKADVDLYICGHDHDAELLGSLRHVRRQPLFLVSGAGAHSVALTKRTKPDEPATIFPRSLPSKPLVGFALLEIAPHTMTITFYDGDGLKRSDAYSITKR